MAKVVVFGTGGGAIIAHKYLMRDSDHEVCAFTVEPEYLKQDEFRGLPVVDFSKLEIEYPADKYKMFVPLGPQELNKLRYRKYTDCKNKGYGFISYVSSTIPFQDEFELGENCLILENNSINFEVKIGNNVTIWSSNHLGNWSVISDHCWISSHACIAGRAKIMPFTFVGINASISNSVTVAEENFIGANALITRDTSAKDVYLIRQTEKAPLQSDKFYASINRDL